MYLSFFYTKQADGQILEFTAKWTETTVVTPQ